MVTAEVEMGEYIYGQFEGVVVQSADFLMRLVQGISQWFACMSGGALQAYLLGLSRSYIPGEKWIRYPAILPNGAVFQCSHV